MKNSKTDYTVSLWESIGIGIGALILFLVGFSYLAWKSHNNNFDSERSQAIARSLISYQIPGGSKGLYGINIGGGQLAIVSSLKNLPNTYNSEIKIIVSKVLITQAENLDPRVFLDSQLIASYSKTLSKQFCNRTSRLLIEKGQMLLSDGEHTSPATQYTLRNIVGNYQREVIITSLGKDSEKKGQIVLQNINCIIREN